MIVNLFLSDLKAEKLIEILNEYSNSYTSRADERILADNIAKKIKQTLDYERKNELLMKLNRYAHIERVKNEIRQLA